MRPDGAARRIASSPYRQEVLRTAFVRSSSAARGGSDARAARHGEISHRAAETPRIPMFSVALYLCASVATSLCLAGRIDFHHGLLAPTPALDVAARRADDSAMLGGTRFLAIAVVAVAFATLLHAQQQ